MKGEWRLTIYHNEKNCKVYIASEEKFNVSLSLSLILSGAEEEINGREKKVALIKNQILMKMYVWDYIWGLRGY